MASKWSDLPRRLLTTAIGVPLMWKVWLENFPRIAFFHAACCVMSFEWYTLTKSPWILLSAALLLVPTLEEVILSLILITSTMMVLSPQHAVVNLHGLLLLGIPMRSWVAVASHPELGFVRVVTLLLTVWLGVDTGALVCGRLVPRRHTPRWLAHVSPQKSVEGILGGLVSGTLVYVSVPRILEILAAIGVPLAGRIPTSREEPADYCCWGVGLLLAVCAVLGDLWESRLKRVLRIKDTSKLLPGHGGIIDRFDSTLITVMAYDYYLSRYSQNSY